MGRCFSRRENSRKRRSPANPSPFPPVHNTTHNLPLPCTRRICTACTTHLCEVAGDPLQCVEAIRNHLRTPPQALQLPLPLLLPLRVRRLARLWRIDVAAHRDLADGVGGEVDGGDLVELVDGTGVDVAHVQVAAWFE